MIHVLIENSTIHSKPKIIQNNNNGLVACVFTIKSGTDIVTVATEPNAINLFKKGDSITIKGVFSPNNAIVGATEIHKGSVPLCIQTQNFPSSELPVQTRRKPMANGTFEVPKSIRRVSEKMPEKVEQKPQTDAKTLVVPSTKKESAAPVKSAKTLVATNTETSTVKEEPVVSDSTTETSVKTTTETDAETGLPLPNFSAFMTNANPSKKAETVSKEKPAPAKKEVTPQETISAVVPSSTSKKKGRWSNEDFAM